MGTTTSADPPCSGQTPAERFPRLAALIDFLDAARGRVDLRRLERMLSELQLTRADIDPVCVFGVKSYRRNRISASEHYELLALCWRSGDCTPIHDHKGSSCAFRVVQGIGTEIRFRMTEAGVVCPVESRPMPPAYVCAAEDDDIHQVANMQPPGEDLVTLHIYSPPISKMHTYAFACSGGAEGAPC